MSEDKGKKKGTRRYTRVAPKNMQEIRERIYEQMPGGLKGYIQKTLTTIAAIEDDAKRARLMIEMLQYFIPKMKAVEVQTDGPQQAIQLNFTRQDGSTVSIDNVQPLDLIDESGNEDTDDTEQ